MAPTVGCLRIAAFADGIPIGCRCVAVSEVWDLALLQLLPPAARPKRKRGAQRYACVQLSPSAAAPKDGLVCVGQPGRPRGERLEVVSGRVVTMVDDPLGDQSNVSADGGLVHSCPVFSGNSGSALLLACSGKLVGIHTGYNDQKYSYHGTTLEAITEFIKLHTR